MYKFFRLRVSGENLIHDQSIFDNPGRQAKICMKLTVKSHLSF